MKTLLKCLLLALLAVMCNLNAIAQDKKQVTGTVKDADGIPVASATVKEKGTSNQVTSNLKGDFKISVTPGATLTITAIGFGARDIVTDASGVVAVQLEPESKELGLVVVTALGIKREKKSLGYAVQELKGESLVSAKEPNLANALIGKVAGLQVVRSSDGPAGSSKIILRGSNSLTGSNQPLIVVDGIPIDNFTGAPDNGYWNRSLDMGNGIADLNPEDIESLSVLKGPSAAALYGSRAGNGVILITTKTGRKQNGLGITVNSSIGVESIFTNPEMQNAFGQGNDGTYANNVTTSWGPKATGQMVQNWNNQNVPLAIYDNVDNYMQQGVTQSHSISFQQQVRQSSVYTSFTRLQDKGLVPGIKLTRTNLTARAVTRFGNDDRWTMDTKVQYSNAKGNNRPIGGRDNSSAYVLYMLPRSIDIRDFKNSRTSDGKMIWFPGAGSQVNPYWGNNYNLNEDSRDRFIMNGSLKYNFTSWLNAEVKAGADLYTTNTEQKVYAGSPLTPTGRYAMGKQTFSETNFSTLITARKDNIFGKLGGMITAGGNLMAQKYTAINGNSGQLVVPDLFSLNNGVNAPTVGEGFNQRRINSLYGSVQVNYDGYLFLDATFRNDWSSTLSKTNRSFFYPSLSLSYVYTDMLRNIGANTPNWLSYGKLRVSYAQVGNDLPAYQLYNTYGIGKDPNGNTVASRNQVLLDPNVQSELIKSFEIGTELRILQNRIGLDFSWYKSNATKQLIDLPMDPQSGYSAKKINAGDIQNTGIEIMLDGRILNNPSSVNWNMAFNFSTNNNTVEELAEGVTKYALGGFDDVAVLAVVGAKYGEIYGTRFNRVKDQSSTDFGKIILNAQGLPTRDPEIVRLGNQQAKALLGVTNSFDYKGIGFSFLIDARFGGEIFSATQVAMQANGTAAVTAPGGNRDNFVAEGVVSNGSGGFVKNTIAVTPQAYWRAVATANNLGVTEANIYDATNIRLRNVQLSYELPRKFLAKSPIQKAKVGISCNNVWMIKSHVRGIDPESVYATNTNATGFENAGLPTTRTFLFNLTLSF
jgi:TonB-linked SusC/RagA family outer membrane protein